jgi:3-oxoacyl-[acyl-carrier-protein] synthase I
MAAHFHNISAYTATSCLGRGNAAMLEALQAGRSGLQACNFEGLALPTFVGEVSGLAEQAMPPGLEHYVCRNNQLAQLGLEQDGFRAKVQAAAQRYGAHRIAVFLGSSTSGLLHTEKAYLERSASGTQELPKWLDYSATHNMFSLADFVRRSLGLRGPASVSSIACASSAKVFATAARALDSGLIDAAVVGGVDTLCLTTLHGFGALELLSPEPCRPYDAHRKGISIGEAAAFVLLERGQDTAPLRLLGYGESSDAHHMSTPHPQGLGAQAALRAALERAALAPSDIDYVNLHGTATPSNDSAEDAAVSAILGTATPVSSTKGFHGHTLGAAGALEAVVCFLAMQHGFLPAGLNLQIKDPSLQANYQHNSSPKSLTHVMSNSFGFGGANCSLVFGRVS